ncbi:MAG: DUF4189 domain-containing protein [Luteimonas sp.]
MHARGYVLFFALSALTIGTAVAQQPGTNAYNTQVLPAHGLGDTRQPRLSWGAFSISPTDQWSGSATGAATEEEASEAAMADCRRRGGTDCAVEFTYANQCVAVAATSTNHAWSRGKSAEDVRSKALAACGTSCEIFYEDCSFHGR